MDADIQGALDQINTSYKCFEHRGKKMSKEQVRKVLEYAKQVGYKTTAELKDREVDEILDKLSRRSVANPNLFTP